jgi:hypothetical protein
MVAQIDAVAWLPNRLSRQHSGTLHFVFHTIAKQYCPQESKDKIAHALAQAGKRATPERPLGYI